MAGLVVARVAKGAGGMWTRIAFPNGDQVMVSMARDEIKLLKMKWRGTIPGETLATLDAMYLAEAWELMGGNYMPLTRTTEILDRVSAMVAICDDANGVKTAFSAKDPRNPPPILKR